MFQRIKYIGGWSKTQRIAFVVIIFGINELHLITTVIELKKGLFFRYDNDDSFKVLSRFDILFRVFIEKKKREMIDKNCQSFMTFRTFRSYLQGNLF